VIAPHAIIGSVEVVGILRPTGNWLDWLRYILPMAVVNSGWDLKRETR
jgi:hypothetical protein